MDALRRALALSIAVIAVLCVVPASWDDADAAGRLDGLMLYEVSPENPDGISLYNYGNEPVDLRDYVVADQPSVSGGREGSLHFTQEIIVQPGTYVVLADADPETSMFTKGEDVYLTSSGNDFGIETEGSFNMANGGDDIYLLSKDGTVQDALFYGDKEADGSQYWTGDPVAIPSDGYIQRTGGTDTDSASDPSAVGGRFSSTCTNSSRFGASRMFFRIRFSALVARSTATPHYFAFSPRNPRLPAAAASPRGSARRHTACARPWPTRHARWPRKPRGRSGRAIRGRGSSLHDSAR